MSTNIHLAMPEKAYSIWEPNTRMTMMTDAEVDRLLAAPDVEDALNCIACGISLRYAPSARLSNMKRCHSCAREHARKGHHGWRERGMP